jgi:hypothetical protein
MCIETLIDPTTATRQDIESWILAWRAKREERLEADKVAAELKSDETKLKELIVSAMVAQKYEGTVINGRMTRAVPKTTPVVDDRQQFEAYIYEHHALDLLQFRISTGAIKERKEAGEEIPGLGTMETYDLSDTKAK